MQRDFFSGLDPTLFRMYHSRLFRWMTPDPAGLNAVRLTDPQTWNMYAYVRNNPANLGASLVLQRGSIVSSVYLRNRETRVK